jgi:glycosyltransferase involved in cell wall biosynthesis
LASSVTGRGADPQTPRPAAPTRFAYLGVFQQYYELELVVAAFAQLGSHYPAASLHFFGDGPLLPRVRELARQSSRITFHGRYDLRRLISSGELTRDVVLLLPYKDLPIARIGSPTKLFEYMALGLPVIASRVGQPAEILRHDSTALLYDAGDAASLASCMRRIIEEEALGPALGRRALGAFVSDHTWAVRMRGLYRALSEIRRARAAVHGEAAQQFIGEHRGIAQTRAD